jgi:hypothetical protein
MSKTKLQKFKNRSILIACIVVLALAFLIPQIYRNGHSAPYCYSSGSQITLENNNTHKLNDYQKQQFTKMARLAIDKKDGPFDWKNYQTVSINVYKMKKPSTYGIIYKIKPVIHEENTITSSIIIKLSDRDLKSYHKFEIKKYSSGFSNFLN